MKFDAGIATLSALVSLLSVEAYPGVQLQVRPKSTPSTTLFTEYQHNPRQGFRIQSDSRTSQDHIRYPLTMQTSLPEQHRSIQYQRTDQPNRTKSSSDQQSVHQISLQNSTSTNQEQSHITNQQSSTAMGRDRTMTCSNLVTSSSTVEASILGEPSQSPSPFLAPQRRLSPLILNADVGKGKEDKGSDEEEQEEDVEEEDGEEGEEGEEEDCWEFGEEGKQQEFAKEEEEKEEKVKEDDENQLKILTRKFEPFAEPFTEPFAQSKRDRVTLDEVSWALSIFERVRNERRETFVEQQEEGLEVKQEKSSDEGSESANPSKSQSSLRAEKTFRA